MRIYTRSGDAGETGLIGGRRVSKGDPLIEALGSVDEANAWLGLIGSVVDDQELCRLLSDCQCDLFELGAELASSGGPARLDEGKVAGLEEAIDRLSQQLPPLKRFVLPGGDRAAAMAHVARTVVRRAERAVVRLCQDHPVHPQGIRYLNRLSDLLFVIARYLNRRAGVDEPTWPQSGR